MVKVSIVIPCYNEEEMLPIFLNKIKTLFIDDDKYLYDFIFINDGSKDKTLDILKKASKDFDNVSYISFTNNFGQDNAITAGLRKASGDVVIPIDCDLQDPPELIKLMLEKYEEGYDIVNPYRKSRQEDSFFKRESSGLFYKFANKVAGKNIVPQNVSMFRLISRKALDVIINLPEVSRVIRSEVPFVGFKVCYIPFERPKRIAGKTKYNLHKLLDLASKTLTSSTVNLLNLPFKLGIIFCILGFLGFLGSLISYIYFRATSFYSVQIFDCLLALFIFLGILLLGLICFIVFIPCMYLKDIQINTQDRPSYIISEEYTSLKALKNLTSDKNE